jgi:predicted phosphodiesterase
MRILVISDIHGNFPALKAVLKDARKVDAVWCLGDLVGYGPYPSECVARVRELPNLVCLMGNHDSAALGQIDLETFNHDARDSVTWTQQNLDAEGLAYLRGLPERIQQQDVTLVHGSPRNPIWEYLLDAYTAADNFYYFDTGLCLTGHSHLPLMYHLEERILSWGMLSPDGPLQVRERMILNPGSVGQPRDNDPRASYAIYLPEEQIWHIHRVAYDIQGVQEQIIKSGLPQRHALRLEQGN